MIPTSLPAPSTSRAAVVSVGGFGCQVAALMTGTVEHAALDGGIGAAKVAPGGRERLDAVFEAAAGPVVMALWRPSPALCDRADELAFRYRRPWLPVMMDHPHVRVGPLVAPGQGACFGCFQARRVQHDDQREVSAALFAAYDRDNGLGPRGYLSHHARIAAALADVMLGQFAEDPATGAGQVVSFNVLGPGIRRHRVVSRSGCRRCGQPSRPGDSGVLTGLIGAIRVSRESANHTAVPAGPGGAGGY